MYTSFRMLLNESEVYQSLVVGITTMREYRKKLVVAKCSNLENRRVHAHCQSSRAPVEIKLLLAVGFGEGFSTRKHQKTGTNVKGK